MDVVSIMLRIKAALIFPATDVICKIARYGHYFMAFILIWYNPYVC